MGTISPHRPRPCQALKRTKRKLSRDGVVSAEGVGNGETEQERVCQRLN